MNAFKQLQDRGYELSDELAQVTSDVEGVCWELDSSLSAVVKDAAGYRVHTLAEPNGGGSYEPGELEAAVARAERLLVALAPLKALKRAWELEDEAQAQARANGLAGAALPASGALH
jgi:hypothetical protein